MSWRPDWIDQWMTSEEFNEKQAREWVRSRPDSVKKVMRLLPPSAIVCSAPGYAHFISPKDGFGVVSSYFESGLVSVWSKAQNGEMVRAVCDPRELSLLDCYKVMTPAWVEAVLDE